MADVLTRLLPCRSRMLELAGTRVGVVAVHLLRCRYSALKLAGTRFCDAAARLLDFSLQIWRCCEFWVIFPVHVTAVSRFYAFLLPVLDLVMLRCIRCGVTVPCLGLLAWVGVVSMLWSIRIRCVRLSFAGARFDDMMLCFLLYLLCVTSFRISVSTILGLQRGKLAIKQSGNYSSSK